MDADVGVVGVGSMGSMVAWQLAERGLSVLGWEQFGTGHDRGGAGGESRVFRTAYSEGPEYVPLLLASLEEWRRLERVVQRELLTLNGGLLIGDPQGAFVQDARQCLEEYGLDHVVLSEQQVRKRYRQHRLAEGEVAILDHTAGFIRPELAVALATLRAEELGARIIRHASVLSVTPDGSGVTIETSGREWRVGKLVVAAGCWTAKLLPQWQPLLTNRRLVMTWFLPKEPHAYRAGRFPIFMRSTAGFGFSGWPTLDGISVKISPLEAGATVDDPDNLHQAAGAPDLGRISAAVRDYLPGLLPWPTRVGVYMDAYTQDGHPAVGELPGVPNLLVLCGFSGHGFKMAPAVGLMAADLITEGATRLDIGFLSPARLEPSPSRQRS